MEEVEDDIADSGKYRPF